MPSYAYGTFLDIFIDVEFPKDFLTFVKFMTVLKLEEMGRCLHEIYNFTHFCEIRIIFSVRLQEESGIKLVPGGRVGQIPPHGVEGVAGAEDRPRQHGVHGADDLGPGDPLQTV
jgi:hypothetical protein